MNKFMEIINSILIKNFLNEPNPKNYYGVSKLIAEKISLLFV